MIRVLASMLMTSMVLSAAQPATEPAKGFIAQSPYDFRFNLENNEWEQATTNLKYVPTNFQYDAYNNSTPLMMVIDLYANKVADKPKSIAKTAITGTLKVLGGAALVVVGIAMVGRMNDYKRAWDLKAAPRPARAPVADGGEDGAKAAAAAPAPAAPAPAAPAGGAAVPGAAAPAPAAAGVPGAAAAAPWPARARVPVPARPAPRGGEDAEDMKRRNEGEHMAAAIQLNKRSKEAGVSINPLVNAVVGLETQVHNFNYQTCQPALRLAQAEIQRLDPRVQGTFDEVHETIEDVRDRIHEVGGAIYDGRQAINNVAQRAQQELGNARIRVEQELANARGIGEQAVKDAQQELRQRASRVEREGIRTLHALEDRGHEIADKTNQFLFTAIPTTLKGLFGIGLGIGGLVTGWKGWKNVQTLLGLNKRSQELEKYKAMIADLLHRKDLNLSVENSDGETALQVVRRHMAGAMHDRESYQMLAEIEQLLLVRQA